MINNVTLTGRLTRDPELRYTANGAAMVNFTVAVNRQFTNAQGEREADFISCQMWRKAAETFSNYTHKGSLVGIVGRIQTRNYENDKGDRVYVTEVVADQFTFLDSKSDNQSNNETQNNPIPKPKTSSNGFSDLHGIDTSRSYDDVNKIQQGNGGIEISEKDLPF
ncbi:single-stranded DNA-binding protein [Companilactobacillus mishanensis]|uniref:Single-stranded DNA-binding protein n=1 Tax=Companilactobacillus mishanensis TaxID=2486008 RepID=A0A5P0ZGG7_9LACO|nr:single-stranded DNA-binding protein [Companilactobacillus mishanensis]MQS52146.1 single-stranded DNA-binding protein [Companilactobacillus mishanensis]